MFSVDSDTSSELEGENGVGVVGIDNDFLAKVQTIVEARAAGGSSAHLGVDVGGVNDAPFPGNLNDEAIGTAAKELAKGTVPSAALAAVVDEPLVGSLMLMGAELMNNRALQSGMVVDFEKKPKLFQSVIHADAIFLQNVLTAMDIPLDIKIVLIGFGVINACLLKACQRPISTEEREYLEKLHGITK